MKQRLFFFIIAFMTVVSAKSQQPDSILYNDSTVRLKKYTLKAAIETFGLNVGVWGFDRFVMNEEFAHITSATISKNLRTGFVWDNDKFSTNLFAHPYHGSLYYNTARSNGLSFWESVPYSFAGSLMWEFTAEREPAAINDFMATSIGGIALGEVTNRMSLLVLDDSKRGFSRVCRELLGTVISPMRGLNRLISGDMWKHKSSHYKYHDKDKDPVKFSATIGDRYIADDNHFFKGENSPYLKFDVIYGNIFDNKKPQPFDYFTLKAMFNLAGNQPLISQINLVAKLWSTDLQSVSGHKLQLGIFQHFNYFDSEEVIDGSGKIPFKISEAASFGPGAIYRFPTVNNFINLEQRTFVSAILLGGSLTDYYNVIDRNYNMGSGFSVKSNTAMTFGKYGDFELNLHHYRIFTWKGYEHKDLTTVDPLYLNAQGDKGNVQLTIINPAIGISLRPGLHIGVEALYYLRNTHYTYREDVSFQIFETRLGLTYEF